MSLKLPHKAEDGVESSVLEYNRLSAERIAQRLDNLQVDMEIWVIQIFGAGEEVRWMDLIWEVDGSYLGSCSRKQEEGGGGMNVVTGEGVLWSCCMF